MKKALVIGASGQDGHYLCNLLAVKGYQVFDGIRRLGHSSVYVDVKDALSIQTAIRKVDPDEIYNLAAQSSVPPSWQRPDETFDINTGGLARILEAVELINKDIKVYQASSSEMFGNATGIANEETQMLPTSPYGISKLAAHKLCAAYRQKGLFVVGGICFNHESPRRGLETVTRKISRYAASLVYDPDEPPLKLGALDARRDWGFAGDYVVGMHQMLQLEQPEDFVLATGETHSIQDFVDAAAEVIGKKIEVGVDARFLRKGEIRSLQGDASKAYRTFGWKPSSSFKDLVAMMVNSDVVSLDLERRRRTYASTRSSTPTR